MGKRELIEAFVRGDIDRRQFVSRLTMLGVSGGAAIAYASSFGASSAVAGPVGTANGFRMRAQEADEEYGTAIAIGVLEALETQAAAIATLVIPLLQSLDDFDPGDFPEGVYELLETIRDQQQEHLDAVNALVEANGGNAVGIGTADAPSSPQDLLTLLSENLDELTATYAAIVPATQDGASRQTLMEAGSVASRHAGLAGMFAQRNPLPSAFQEPAIATGI
jgi:hypothetical protein